MATYSIGAAILFLISQPDLKVDPILRTYQAFHPCVIIDYTPGNLWAQLTFLLYVYCLLMSATMSLLRVVKMQKGVLVVFTAQAYGIAWITLPVLVLACTFNPGLSSVLLHSLPYMVCIGGIGVFMISEVIVLFWTSEKTTWKHYACYIYNIILLGATGYAILFMSKHLATTELIDVTLPITDPRNTLEPQELEISVVTTALAFSILPLHWLRPFFSPLTEKPLVADVVVQRGLSSAESPHMFGGSAGLTSAWHMALDASTLGLCGRISCALGFSLAYFFNSVFSTEPHSYRDKFEMLPGAAIIALMWTLGVPLMALQTCVMSMYVKARYPTGIFRMFFVGVSIFFSISAVLAHGGTVPRAPKWYIGSQLFQAGVILYGIGECILVLKELGMKGMALVKVVMGIITAIFLLLSQFWFNRFSFIAYSVCWIVYTAIDPLDVKMIFSNIDIGTTEQSPGNVCNNLFHWVWKDREFEY
jgi:hypothetical protein